MFGHIMSFLKNTKINFLLHKCMLLLKPFHIFLTFLTEELDNYFFNLTGKDVVAGSP